MDRGTRLMLGMLTIAVCMLTAKFVFESEPEAQANYAMAGDPEPTIVWYGTIGTGESFVDHHYLYRAWSDGVVEHKNIRINFSGQCSGGVNCTGGWIVVSHPNEGRAAMSDINGDEDVDVLDLLTVIERWGPAPHNFIPPSDCPLAMINP
jgi:hypothetical protein